MESRADRRLLTRRYRLGWRIRYLGMHVFGPAQLGVTDDPHERLLRERARRVERARTARGSQG